VKEYKKFWKVGLVMQLEMRVVGLVSRCFWPGSFRFRSIRRKLPASEIDKI